MYGGIDPVANIGTYVTINRHLSIPLMLYVSQ